MPSTRAVSQRPMSWLKAEAPKNLHRTAGAGTGGDARCTGQDTATARRVQGGPSAPAPHAHVAHFQHPRRVPAADVLVEGTRLVEPARDTRREEGGHVNVRGVSPRPAHRRHAAHAPDQARPRAGTRVCGARRWRDVHARHVHHSRRVPVGQAAVEEDRILEQVLCCICARHIPPAGQESMRMVANGGCASVARSISHYARPVHCGAPGGRLPPRRFAARARPSWL